MLQKQTVSTELLELLTELMGDDHLHGFILVGGTALSLQIGHRKSRDIVLFNMDNFDENKLYGYLDKNYKFKTDYIDRNTLKGGINDIKVDFITHAYPMVNKPWTVDHIRIADTVDIVAMKLNAIAENGTSLKDFVDIAWLSSSLNLSEMLGAYEIKYPSSNPLTATKALAYYDDINFNEPLNMLQGNFNWIKIENRLSNMLAKPDKYFEPLS